MTNNINYYAYLRVSTAKQDIGRQIVALNDWQKEKNIIISEKNIFTDYYSGKTFDRENYQKLKSTIKPGDYLIVKEVDRLGRNWDGIKSEWQELQNNGIKIIIIDMSILSDPLPNQKETIEGLDLRLIKSQILELMCYSAQKEREKISQRTKEGLKATKEKGTKLGRQRSKWSSQDNFIYTLKYMIDNNVGQKMATLKTRYPINTFKLDLKKCYEKYNTKDYKMILENLEKDGVK